MPVTNQCVYSILGKCLNPTVESEAAPSRRCVLGFDGLPLRCPLATKLWTSKVATTEDGSLVAECTTMVMDDEEEEYTNRFRATLVVTGDRPFEVCIEDDDHIAYLHNITEVMTTLNIIIAYVNQYQMHIQEVPHA